MRLITQRDEVLERLAAAGRAGAPLLCPNAETPDEMEGIMAGAQRYAADAQRRITVGIGCTATYPDHPQLGGLRMTEVANADALATTARIWLDWLHCYARAGGPFDAVEVIPFLDHGWVPHAGDLSLMQQRWFQEAMGIVMFDASAFDFETNVQRTAAYVREARSHVVVEACPDKIYERTELEAKNLREADLLSRPGEVEQFVRATGVDLIVPNLGTEHRTTSTEPLHYRRDIAVQIAARVGPIQALHGTSSLGAGLGTLGQDGVCKVNYYTAMTRAATAAVRAHWAGLSAAEAASIRVTCGSFLHRTRRQAIAENIFSTLGLLESGRRR